MRKYVFIALVILAAGIGISLTLIPTKTEVAALKSTDAQQAADLSGVNVEAEYNNGNRSLPVVAAMADKKVAGGDRPAAVKILEEYVAANARDVNGRKKLAEQYQLSGNQKGFNEQIEIIAAAAPTEENLRLLSDIYNASKEYPKQAEVLKKIVDVTKGEKPQAFVDLATIQVAIGDTEGAVKTVEALNAKHPKFTSYPTTRIMVNVLAGRGEPDKALAAAKGWMEAVSAPVPTPATPAPEGSASPAAAAATADDKPQQLADLINILHYSGYADKAVELAAPYTAMLEHSPELVLAYVNANITAGKSDAAYAVLKAIDDKGAMIAALYPPYLDLTLKRANEAGAQAIATKLDVATFNEEQALNTIEIARAHSADAVLKTLTTRFGDAVVLKDKPVLAAVIAILTNDKTQDAKIDTALNLELTSTQRIRLAETCARAGKTECFNTMVKQYPPLEQMAPEQVAEYAQLFIIANRQNEIVDSVGKLANTQGSAVVVQHAYHRLAAAAGRTNIISPWLQANAKTISGTELQELFYLANDRKHSDVARDIAERLYARDPSPMNRDIMIAAYVGSGNYEKAVPLLREQMKEANANDGLYLSALSKVARTDKEAKKELTDYAEAALKSQRGDGKAQLNYAYILINNGKKDAAIPYIKTYAKERGGEWQKLYAQLTSKPAPGKPASKLTREQMIAMATSPGISREGKRQMAFGLLNDGYKTDAIAIFKDLAKDKGPDSQEVKDLLYLWGGKLGSQELAWVKARAANANAYDKKRWGDLVNSSADDAAVMSYVGGSTDALYNPDLRKKYLRTVAKGGREQYENAMREWVAKTTDVNALLDYATIGQASGFKDAATNGYERVLQIDPNNRRALSQLAAMDFAKGKFSSADARVNQYIANERATQRNDETSAEVHFYKAQLLRRQGNKAQANAEFAYVLQLATKTGTSAPDALSRIYTAQFHLGQHAQAKAGFEQLLQQYPTNKGVLADYMSVLIEYNYLQDASRIAQQYDLPQRRSDIVGHAHNTASAAHLKGSMLISSKPGYVVKIIPTANVQYVAAQAAPQQPRYAAPAQRPVYAAAQQVAPQPAPNPQAIEAQRQQQLRLQLLYARIEQNAGQTEKAAQRLAAIEYYYPNDPQVLAYKASLANARGDTGQAKEYISQAQSVAPENEDYARFMSDLSTPRAHSVNTQAQQYIRYGFDYRDYGDDSDIISTLTGVARVSPADELGLSLSTSYRDNSSYHYRDQAELFWGHYLPSGSRLQASLFTSGSWVDDEDSSSSYDNESNWGGGLYFAFDNALGRTELIGEYQKPYWDFPAAATLYSTRTRGGFKHFSQVSPNLSLGTELTYNSYNVETGDSPSILSLYGITDDTDIEQTVLFRLSTTYAFQKKTKYQPMLGMSYGFDGEYVTDDTPALNYIDSREVHQLLAVYRDDWSASTHSYFGAGWVYDRMNDVNGPVAEGRLDFDLTQRLLWATRARYGLISSGSSFDSDNSATEVGTNLTYKF